MIGKRAFDLLSSGIALFALLPVFLVISAAIKLDSSGPVFFRQVRIGRNCRPFRIHKFRTMHVLQAAAPQITVGRDPRITRIGHILRRYKLDELPQLIDVLRGAMSIVGPRPEVPKYVAMYPEEVRKSVFSVRPGITDEASIHFIDEAALLATQPDPETFYVETLLPRKCAYHLDYVKAVSLGRDLRIILTTLARIVAPRGPQTI